MYRPEHFVSALLSLRPTLRPRDGDFTVDNTGNGPFIASWNRDDLVQPTQQQIEAVDTDLIYSGPVSVTPRQARLALLGAGLLDQVEAAVVQAGGTTQITWEYATEIRRDDPLIESIGNALGLNEAQKDALFAAAATF